MKKLIVWLQSGLSYLADEILLQSQKNLASILILLAGKFLYSEKFLRGYVKIWLKFDFFPGHSGNFLKNWESFWIPWTISGLWKVSEQSVKFTNTQKKIPDTLDSFRNLWKVPRISGKFPKSLQKFWNLLKVSRISGKFLESLENFWSFWKVS